MKKQEVEYLFLNSNGIGLVTSDQEKINQMTGGKYGYHAGQTLRAFGNGKYEYKITDISISASHDYTKTSIKIICEPLTEHTEIWNGDYWSNL